MDKLFSALVSQEDVGTKQALSDAYNETFSKKHSFMLRKGVRLAIWAAPSDEKFCTMLQIGKLDELGKAADGFRIVR